MARKLSKNTTKLVNKSGETIELVAYSSNGNPSTPTKLDNEKEVSLTSEPSDTNRTLHLYDGKKNPTNIIITTDDLLTYRELTITKTAPPSTSNAPPLPSEFRVKKIRRHQESTSDGKCQLL